MVGNHPQIEAAVLKLPEAARESARIFVAKLGPSQNVTNSLIQLIEALSLRGDAVELAAIIANHAAARSDLSLDVVLHLVEVHDEGDLDSFKTCLELEPPPEVTVHRMLPARGSQKQVFLATWNLRQRSIVLKRFLKNGQELIARELHPHPLSMVHPNIIETHLLRNSKGDEFLVERKLPATLTDAWRSSGLEEGASLARDICEALVFLEAEGLIHGDIKPDNIGREASRFILLDFGICRKASAFLSNEVTPTGSLRTRAPELLKGQGHTFASDLWALGATVFNAVVGKFPLFLGPGEIPPPVSDATEREKFEQELLSRCSNRWQELVVDPLKGCASSELAAILARLLQESPSSRPSAKEALVMIEEQLRPFLQTHSERRGRGPLSPREAEQLAKYYEDDMKSIRRMPLPELFRLRERLRDTLDPAIPDKFGSVFNDLKRNIEAALADLTKA
jgi:serine/threonine protein kinase